MSREMCREPANLVREHLEAILGGMSRMADKMNEMATEMTALRHHLAGLATLQNSDHGRISGLDLEIEQNPKRISFLEAQMASFAALDLKHS